MTKERESNNFPIYSASGGRAASLPVAYLEWPNRTPGTSHRIPPDLSKSGSYCFHVPNPLSTIRIFFFLLITSLALIGSRLVAAEEPPLLEKDARAALNA